MAPRVNRPSSSKSKFAYKPRTAETVKERSERKGGRFDSIFKSGADEFRCKVGDNQIRILQPTWDDHDHYAYEIWVHNRIGPDNSTYLCPRKMGSGKCPICAAEKEAKDSGEEEEAKALAVSQRYVCWILDRDGDEEIPLLYSMSFTQDRDLAGLCYNKRTGQVLLIDHPDEGYDVLIRRNGQGLNTKYIFSIDRSSTSISDDSKKVDKILEYIHENPVPTMLSVKSSDYLSQVLSGTAEKDEDADDEEEVKPRKRGGREEDGEDEEIEADRKSSRKALKKDEEDEAPFDDEEEEKPRRRPSRDEDEEEEEKPRKRKPVDDDEEEEKPRSRRRDDEEDEEERPRKHHSRTLDGDDEPAPRKKPASRRDDDEDDATDEEPEEADGEEEERPRRRAVGRR